MIYKREFKKWLKDTVPPTIGLMAVLTRKTYKRGV